MTDRLRAAAQAALEALINGKNIRAGEGGTKHQPTMEDAAIKQLRAALAEPEEKQEPVAWRFQSAVGGWAYGSQPPVGSKYPVYPLYAAPTRRDWVSLTNEKIVDLWAGVSPVNDDDVNIIELGRAIEAALREKNG